jgi:geranylgeranyl pyrophosphate synthase
MDYTMNSARKECELARQALAGLSPSEHRQALLDLLDFVVDRRS